LQQHQKLISGATQRSQTAGNNRHLRLESRHSGRALYFQFPCARGAAAVSATRRGLPKFIPQVGDGPIACKELGQRISVQIRNLPEEEFAMATTIDARRETVSLIGSDKIEGTAVYGADDRKIGSVQRVMIDKISGKVAYAVVSFGGFLGMGEDYYPMPWPNLKYDTAVGGYRVGITEDQLKSAPKFNRNTDWDWSDRARDETVYEYYHTPLW